MTFRAVGSLSVTVAQVDHMSGGRVEVGLGAGWYAAEHEAFGLPFPPVGERMDALEDQVAILHGLWSTPPGETFGFEGSTTSVRIAADSVRPRQQPGPPLILGGQARAALGDARGDVRRRVQHRLPVRRGQPRGARPGSPHLRAGRT